MWLPTLQFAEEISVGNNPLHAMLISIEPNSGSQRTLCPTFIAHTATSTSPSPILILPKKLKLSAAYFFPCLPSCQGLMLFFPRVGSNTASLTFLPEHHPQTHLHILSCLSMLDKTWVCLSWNSLCRLGCPQTQIHLPLLPKCWD